MVLRLRGGPSKGRRKNNKLPQAINAEEIAKREAMEERKKQDRKARRGSDSDDDKKKKGGKDDDSDSDSEDFFESQDEDEEESSEEAEEKVQKVKGVADFIDFEGAGNVNKTKVANVKAKDLKLGDGTAPKPELSRREREEIEKRRAKEAYDRKHAAGETDEAKADMARLAEVRRRRAEAAEAKAREAEEAAAAEAAEKASAKKKPADDNQDVQLALPPPSAVKDSLLKMKDIMDDGFQKKHNLKNSSGNKLAKMKYKDFQTIFEAFNEAATPAQKKEFLD